MASNIVEIKLSEIDKVQEVLSKQNQEIERLNNIINLMSDFLVKHIANASLDFMYRQGFKETYVYLQELKGSE